MMSARLHHASITTADLDRLTAFYRENFGFEPVLETSWEAGNAAADAIFGLKDSAVRMVMLRAGNAFLELFEFANPQGASNDPGRRVCDAGITHICIATDDIEADYARLTQQGIPFTAPPQDLSGICSACYGRDPDGNIVELMQPDPAGPFAL
jgi:catechol 2,3-dioxygenase-like lactoylglutathione lyase family enzyme